MSELLSNKITLGKWEFHRIQLGDMERYSEFIQATDYPANLWSSNFAYLWSVSQSRSLKILWRIVDDMLVTFGHSSRNTLNLFCLPMGEGTPEKLIDVVLKAVRYCCEWNEQVGRPAMVRMINQCQLAYLRRCPDFDSLFRLVTLQGIERHLDVEKLVMLSGKAFQTVRTKMNKFQRENAHATLRSYDSDDEDTLIHLGEEWDRSAGRKYRHIVDRRYYRGLIHYCQELGQHIWVVHNGETIIGMVAGSQLPTGNAWGSLLKYREGIPGLSEFLSVSFARELHRLYPHVKLINIGSDLGAGGLRDYKLKFRPVLNLKRYQVHLK